MLFLKAVGSLSDESAELIKAKGECRISVDIEDLVGRRFGAKVEWNENTYKDETTVRAEFAPMSFKAYVGDDDQSPDTPSGDPREDYNLRDKVVVQLESEDGDMEKYDCVIVNIPPSPSRDIFCLLYTSPSPRDS